MNEDASDHQQSGDDDYIDTETAADLSGLSRPQVQKLCRDYMTWLEEREPGDDTPVGLVCKRIGDSPRRSIYLVSRAAALAYRDTEHKTGFPKGGTRAGLRGRKVEA